MLIDESLESTLSERLVITTGTLPPTTKPPAVAFIKLTIILTREFPVSIFGTIIIFIGSYLVEKLRTDEKTRGLVQFFALMPMAVPGLVLGLSYIFFFNATWTKTIDSNIIFAVI